MNSKILKSGLLTFFVSIFSATAQQEQPEEMVTDRPDQTEAPSLVSKGFFQVETGFFYEERGNEFFDEKTTGYNTTLLRYGLLENLEIRLGWDYVKRSETMAGTSSNISGLEPLLLGAKIGIAEEKGALPQIGLIGHLYLPFIASEEFRPETVGVDFRFAFSHSFSNSDLSYNVGAEWRDDSPEANFIYTIAYGIGVTDKLSAFAEVYGDLPEDSGAQHFWDAGLTYLIRNNIQLDAYVGTGINNDQSILAGGGISFRLPI